MLCQQINFVLRIACACALVTAALSKSHHKKKDFNPKRVPRAASPTESPDGDWDIVATATAVRESKDANLHFMRPTPTPALAVVAPTGSSFALSHLQRKSAVHKRSSKKKSKRRRRSFGKKKHSSRSKRSVTYTGTKPIRSPLYRITIDIPRLEHRRSIGLPLENPQPTLSKKNTGGQVGANSNSNKGTVGVGKTAASVLDGAASKPAVKSDDTSLGNQDADSTSLADNSDDAALDSDADDGEPASDDQELDNDDDASEDDTSDNSKNSNGDEEKDDSDEAPTAVPDVTGEASSNDNGVTATGAPDTTSSSEKSTSDSDAERLVSGTKPEEVPNDGQKLTSDTENNNSEEESPTASPDSEDEVNSDPTAAPDSSEAPTSESSKKSHLVHRASSKGWNSWKREMDPILPRQDKKSGETIMDRLSAETYNSEPGMNQAGLKRLEDDIDALGLTKKSSVSKHRQSHKVS